MSKSYCAHRTPTRENPSFHPGYCVHPKGKQSQEFQPCVHAKQLQDGRGKFNGWRCDRPDTDSVPLPVGDRCTNPSTFSKSFCAHRTPTNWCKPPDVKDDRHFQPCSKAKPCINGLNQFIGWYCDRMNTSHIPPAAVDECSHPNGSPDVELICDGY